VGRDIVVGTIVDAFIVLLIIDDFF
jgi:hypothetical protein